MSDKREANENSTAASKPPAVGAAGSRSSKARPSRHARSAASETATANESGVEDVTTDRMLPAASGVRVRMYRQGLGDCFLLCFRGDAGEPVYMLIDCGVILGTREPASVMSNVVSNIRDATGGHLHYLLATHEHWDHLSGFIQAQAIFEQISFGQVWLAWTEDPADTLANELRARRNQKQQALAAAVGRMGMAGLSEPGRQIAQILQFFGNVPGAIPHAILGAAGVEALELGAAGKSANTAEALRYLTGRAGDGVRYRHPGEPPIAISGVNGVRVFVLGPPHDSKQIRWSNPTKKGREVYDLAATKDSLAGMFLGAASSPGPSEPAAELEAASTRALSRPFDGRFGILREEAEKHPFFRAVYFGDSESSGDATDTSWRMIEHDWLNTATELALSLDSNTNNTSLAIAIECGGAGGKVLLFPADAQVGNWMSWSSCAWPGAGDADSAVDAADLLRRTVLYKVGHHGSHNATARANGLELMTSPELVALVPVDHAMAEKKGWGKMPFDPLMKRLAEKTRGRVIRIDQGVAQPPGDPNDAAWTAFKSRISEPADQLYFDYRIDLD